jgi:multisubunit Na+/H+ antiporter MnhB subunit
LQVDRISAVGALLAVIAVASFAAFLLQFPFESFAYSTSPDHFIGVDKNIGAEESIFLWSFRSTDLMAQALAIFAASVSCLAMLRVVNKEESE